MKIKQREKLGQKGAILPLLAVTIIVLIGIIGYSIDTSRSSYTVNSIQESIDNAALSASRQLNGEFEGWNNAKSAAILNLQNNRINSVSKKTLDNLVFNIDGPLGDNTIAHQDNLRVSIARGVFWSDGGSKQFVSLENGVQDRANGPWDHADFSQHVFSNAINIEVTLSELDASAFSQAAFGQESINNLTRKAVAINDAGSDFLGTPFAIPYCQFLLNNDSNEETNHELLSFDPSKSVSRELIFTELNGFVTGSDDPDFPTADDERREGFRRYAWQIYNPTFSITGSNLCNESNSGQAMSCKNVPMRGLIGVFGSTPGTSTIGEVKDFIDHHGERRVELGNHFKPLAQWSDNEVLMDEITESMQNFLDQGSSTIESEFIYEENGRKYAKASFPAVRHQQLDSGANDFMKRPAIYADFGDDLRTSNRITWPISIGGDTFTFAMLLGLHRNPGQQTPVGAITNAPFINTMCNNADEKLDRSDYKVRTQPVVIIAPSSDLETYDDGNPVSYCDFENQFRGQAQNSKVPWEKNEPRVVGRTTINFVGFNFKKLPNAPEYTDATLGTRIAEFRTDPLRFDNPAVLELDGVFRPEVRQYEDEYHECSDSIDNGNPDENACDLGVVENGFFVPGELSNCFDDGPLVGLLNEVSSTSNECKNKRNLVNSASNAVQRCTEDLEQANNQKSLCSEDQLSQYSECVSRAQSDIDLAQECRSREDTNYNLALNELNQCLEVLSEEFNGFTFSSAENQVYSLIPLPNTFCLPLPKEQAHNFNAAESYETPIRPLRSGRGCGGVRARVSESEVQAVLTSGKPWVEMKPSLVAE